MVFGNFLMRGLNKIGSIGKELLPKAQDSIESLKKVGLDPEKMGAKLLNQVVKGFEGKK